MKIFKNCVFVTAFVMIFWPTGAAGVPGEDEFPHYELFNDVLTTLCEDHWSPSGNWRGDMMHDATAFAPYVLLNWGEETGDQDLLDKGWATIYHEDRSIGRWLQDPGNPFLAYKAVMGFPAYLYAYEFTGARFYLFRVRPLLKLLTDVCLAAPEQLETIPFFSAPTIFGVTSYADFLLYHRDPVLNILYNLRGMLVLARGEELYLDEVKGLYECPGPYVHDYDWPNGTMLNGLAWGYKTTGVFTYKMAARDLAEAIEEHLADQLHGGYFSDIDHGEPRTKYLSGNMTILWGLVSLYEIDKDPVMLERIETLLEFVETDLYHEDLCYHHWTEGEGRADDYCTGCNFLLLNNLYNLHLQSGDE